MDDGCCCCPSPLQLSLPSMIQSFAAAISCSGILYFLEISKLEATDRILFASYKSVKHQSCCKEIQLTPKLTCQNHSVQFILPSTVKITHFIKHDL